MTLDFVDFNSGCLFVHLPCHLCPICTCPSRIRQTEEHTKSKSSVKPLWSLGILNKCLDPKNRHSLYRRCRNRWQKELNVIRTHLKKMTGSLSLDAEATCFSPSPAFLFRLCFMTCCSSGLGAWYCVAGTRDLFDSRTGPAASFGAIRGDGDNLDFTTGIWNDILHILDSFLLNVVHFETPESTESNNRVPTRLFRGVKQN